MLAAIAKLGVRSLGKVGRNGTLHVLKAVCGNTN